MKVYRICLAKWATKLTASGYPARWNSKGRFVLYTAGSRALACLENVVHRSSEGLGGRFKVMLIEIPEHLEIEEIKLGDLEEEWFSFESFYYCQSIGNDWIDNGKSAVLKVPSVIVPNESNYIINIQHPDFNQIKLTSTEDFNFDPRIKK